MSDQPLRITQTEDTLCVETEHTIACWQLTSEHTYQQIPGTQKEKADPVDILGLAKQKEQAYEHCMALALHNISSTIEGRVSQDLEYRRAKAKWQKLEDQYHRALDEETE
jgi:hypothetical protein